MADDVFTDSTALQLTRTTSAFSHRLLESLAGEHEADDANVLRPQYVWEVTVTVIGNLRYEHPTGAGSTALKTRAI